MLQWLNSIYRLDFLGKYEAPEGVNWELGFAFLEGWELGFFNWDWDLSIVIGINTLQFRLGLCLFIQSRTL